MIGSINQNATFSLAAQLASINSSDIMLQPGENVPDESTPSSASSPSSSSHGIHLSNGAIAGIVVAGVLVLALACALFWFVGRHRTLKASLSNTSQTSNAVESWVNSTQPPSSTISGPTSARPSSYGFGDGSSYTSPYEPHKSWDLHNQRFSYLPLSPPIQELSAAEPVEMEETSRGRTRDRENE